jgi:hypothetical protein
LALRTRLGELDFIGTAVLIPAIIMLLLALQWGGTTYAWNSAHIIGLFCGFGVMTVIFVGIQLWKGDEGTLPPRLFKNRNVLCAMMYSFFFGAGFFPLVYYLCKCILPPPGSFLPRCVEMLTLRRKPSTSRLFRAIRQYRRVSSSCPCLSQSSLRRS